MKRRSVLFSIGAWLAACAMPAHPQGGRPRRIAFFHPGTEETSRVHLEAFRAALRERGHVEGRDVSIETSWGGGKTERMEATAAQIVARKPDLIVTATSAATAAFKKATTTIPIVFATGFNPVEQGLVSSLRHPGGNVTGVLVYSEIAGKIVEVAREAFPRAQRLAILVHVPDSAHKFALEQFVAAAPRFEFESIVVRVTRVVELDRVFAEVDERRADALYMADLAFNYSHHEQLIERALQRKLPLLSGYHDVTEKGGLLSYGGPREENYRRAAALADRILRGASVGDLPVEQPEHFQLVVNRKTANAIGVSVSAVTMLRADRIID